MQLPVCDPLCSAQGWSQALQAAGVGMFLEPFVSSCRGIDVKVPLLNLWGIAWQFMDTLVAPPILVASPVIV